MVSPCGATYFAHVGKVGKAPPEAAHGHLIMPYPASPGPPLFLRGSHQGARLYPSGAGKRQDTASYAVRCRSVLVKQVLAPTRAIAPGFQTSRGGSVVAPPPWLVLRAGEWLQHSPPLGLQRPFGPLTSAPIPALEFSGYRQPPGVHPIGGRGPLIGRFKKGGFQRGEENRNPSHL